MPTSPHRLSLLPLTLILLAVCPQVLAQGAFSTMRDMIVEGAENVPALVEKREKYRSAIERFNERFVEPVVRFGEQYKCSAGYKGNECEKLFPETRERIGEFRETAQSRLKSLAESGQAAAVESRTGLQRMLETDAEKKDRIRSLNDLAVMELREQQEREKARIAAISARAEREAREFEQRQALRQREEALERARQEQAAQEEAEVLAVHESEVNDAVGLFLNVMGTAVNSYAAEKSRLQTQQAQQAQRQQQQQQRQQSGSGSSGNNGGNAPYCYKEEGPNGRYMCQ